jgi:hypothetical protein
MTGLPYIDIPATIGEGIDRRDFQLAVHLTIYWAQDMTGGPIWKPAVSRLVASKLCRAMPLDEQEDEAEDARWPPSSEQLDLTAAPKEVPMQAVTKGFAGWLLEHDRFLLRKQLGQFVSDVRIEINEAVDRITVRQTVTGGVSGVPRNLKMISAAIGLYDGDVRLLPVPMTVDNEQDVAEFLELVEHPDRRQPMWAIAQQAADSTEEQVVVERCARECFGLQHVVWVTLAGLGHMRYALGPHSVLRGAIKTYRPGFKLTDMQDQHQIMTNRAVQTVGLANALDQLHRRRMMRDAVARRYASQ